jgi:hypothetical protein
MSTKEELDQRIAVLSGRAVYEVAAITSTFLRLIVHDLIRGEKVELRNFGFFSMDERPRGAFTISFRHSSLFKRLLKQHRYGEGHMEKYGVDETKAQEQLEKLAAEGCPACGGEVTREGHILLCRNCGTAPFEAKQKD